MDVRIDVQPLDDLSPGQIATVTKTLRDGLLRLPDVDEVKPINVAAPDGAKGLLDEIGALLVSTPVITGVFDTIKALLSRPGSPGVTIKVTKDGVEGTFNPKTVTPEQFAALAASLRQSAAPA